MKYHIWYRLCPIGHNTVVITAGLGSIMENETPANALKHPLPVKELSECCNCVYLLPCLYFITLDLRDAIKKRQNFGNSYRWVLCLGRPFSCILGVNHYYCLSSPTFYSIFSKPSPMEEAEKANSLLPETGSTVLPRTSGLSGFIGLKIDEEYIWGPDILPQPFCPVWFLKSFFVRHRTHPTYS